MAERSQVFEVVEVTRTLLVKDVTELNQTTIRGQLTVGDTETHARPAVHFCGSLTVDGTITGNINGLIDQINASNGVISAERIDPRLVADLRGKLARTELFSQIAIFIAFVALLVVIVVLVL